MSTSPANPPLTYLLAFFAGLAGAVVGFVAVGLLGDFVLGLQGMSDREGYRAMVSFFYFAPFGAIAGLLTGSALVLRYQGGIRGFARLAGRSALIGCALAAVAGLGVWAYARSVDILVTNGPTPQLHFEIRMPQGTTLPTGSEVQLETDKNTMPAAYLRQGNDGAKPVLSGAVDLYFRTSHRVLVLRAPGEPDRLFILKLASDPAGSAEFGPWQTVSQVADQPDGGLRRGGKDDDYQARYRVERAD